MLARGVLIPSWAVFALLGTVLNANPSKQLIAHRGASGYAPEHTLAAYRLAIEQRADFVEQDLGVTRDGVLICLHDDTLDRVSDVARVFPERSSNETIAGRPGPHWIANDFTLDEIRKLDIGTWFDPKFASERIVTWQEAIDLIRTRPGLGLYPELKKPPLYTARGIDMVRLFVESIKRNGLDKPDSLRDHPVIIQSFDEEAIRRVANELPSIPRVLLLNSPADLPEARLREIASFATGIAPDKAVLVKNPEIVGLAHAVGLTVTAWTFRADEGTAYPSVRDEMNYFLSTLGIDALFTNNPDQFPR